jgi:hypothetical protein
VRWTRIEVVAIIVIGYSREAGPETAIRSIGNSVLPCHSPSPFAEVTRRRVDFQRGGLFGGALGVDRYVPRPKVYKGDAAQV